MQSATTPAGRPRRLAALLFGVAVATSAAAQTSQPGLLRDVAVSPMPMAPGLLLAPAMFLPRGGETYFAGWDLTDGLELRATDGTAAGTRTVRDVCPGSCNGLWGYELVESGGILYFAGDDGVHGRELWKSDGTREGTRMVAEVIPGPNPISPHFLTPAPGGVYFTAVDDDHGWELWWSDGTAAGTHLVVDLLPGFGPLDHDGPSHLAYLPGHGLVFAAEDGIHGRELWLTQGTVATTTLLADIWPGGSSGLAYYQAYPDSFAAPRVAGGKLFFTADDAAHGSEPWVSDGTPAGTTMAADVVPGAEASTAYAYFPFGSTVLFAAGPMSGPRTLWRSDGTPAGTFALGDAAHGSDKLNPFVFAELGGTVYFPGYQTATGAELWSTDGTLAGTHLAVELLPGAGSGVVAYYGFAAAAGRLWFHGDDGVHGFEWWQSDGSSGGTFQVADLIPGATGSVDPWRTTRPAAAGTHVLFTAFDDVRGWAVRAGEPGITGTAVLQAAGDRAGSVAFCTLWNCPTAFVPTAQGVAFTAVDGAHGPEPWRSDGSDAGTQLVADIAPGPSGSMAPYYSTFRTTASLGDDLLLLASDCTSSSCSEADVQLWRADAAGGLTRLTNEAWALGPSDLVSWQGSGYFAGAGQSSNGLWQSDGTPAGTAVLAGPNRAWSFSPGAAAMYFSDGLLWKTDGTAGGTVPIAHDLSLNGIGRLSLTDDGDGHDRLYFPGSDEEAGLELWMSDGTDGGTHRVVDLLPGAADGMMRFPRPGRFEDEHLVATLGPLGIFAASDGTHGDELWVTDGTPGKATLLEIRPGAASAEPRDLVTVGNRVYFVADDGVHGREPWVTDGTLAGTHIVADVRVGAESSAPLELTDWMGRLLFAADDDVHGMELWRAEPDGNGAQLVVDLRPGVAPASPQGLTAVGERLYFMADDGTTGVEPWMWSAAADLFADGFESGSFSRWSRVQP